MSAASVGTSPSGPGGGSGRSPWGGVALVIVALAALHVGAGLLLTRKARASVAEIEATWTTAQLDAAVEPGAPPATVGEGYAAWRRAQQLWEDARKRDERGSQVRALTLAALGSFALQAGAVALLGWRASRRR